MRVYLLLIFCFLLNHLFANFNEAIIKINLINGEKFVTPKIKLTEIDKKVEAALAKMKIERVFEQNNFNSLIFVDVFIYQHTTDYPSVVFTARTKKGVHYFKSNYQSFFRNKNVAVDKIVDEILYDLPENFNPKMKYNLSIDQIIFHRDRSFSADMSNALFRTNFLLKINWDYTKALDFIIENELKNYLKTVLNLRGSKNKLKNKYLVLKLKVNADGTTKITNFDIPFKIKAKNKLKITESINALPTFITDEFEPEFELIIGY